MRPDFDVVSTGNESRNQSSTFIINGRVTQQNSFGHAYRFRLTPKRTGKLVIPAPSATIDGKTVSGRALTLNVIAPEAQDLVIPEMKADREKVYPTQPFEVTLRVLVRPLPDDPDRDPLGPLRRRPPHIEVNWVDLPAGLTGEDKARWLEKLLSEDGSGFALNDITMRSGAFSFFDGPRAAVFNLYQGRESRKGLDGRPVNYFVYELKRKLTAEKTGTYTLGPAVVKGSFVEGMKGSNYTGRRLVAVAPAVSVEVREVPAPRPATFCGGIGNYRLAASASPTTLRVGDPLTLTLDFERGQASGSLDLISAPDLAATPQIADDFEIVDKNPTGRRDGEVKRFEYALRPKRAGVGIPSLAVTVFNPDTEKFSEITTQPIALAVSAAGRLDAGDLVGSLSGSGTQEIKSRAQGIFQNVTDPSELNDERVNVVALAEVTVGFMVRSGVPDRGRLGTSPQIGRCGLAAKTARAAHGRTQAGRGPQSPRRGTIDGRTAGHSIGLGRVDRRHAERRRRGPDGVGSRRDPRPDRRSRRHPGGGVAIAGSHRIGGIRVGDRIRGQGDDRNG